MRLRATQLVSGAAALMLLLGVFLGLQAGALEVAPPPSPFLAAFEAKMTTCNEPRPEICYEHYAPVCALRQSVWPCSGPSCALRERASYANDCLACADRRVSGFQPGGECR